MLSKILRNLYLSDVSDATKTNGDYLVYYVAPELPPDIAKIDVMIPLKDGVNTEDNRQLFLSAIRGLIMNYRYNYFGKKACIVCCSAGISRSPAVVIGFLMGIGFSYDDALEYVESHHSRTNIDPVFDRWLREIDKNATTLYGNIYC
jgi:protein-tyrosine phosphatase